MQFNKDKADWAKQMQFSKDKADWAKQIAEAKFKEKHYEGALKYAKKAQGLYPQLDGISDLIEVVNVHIAASTKDWYRVLQCDSSTADERTISKQFKKLALVLHPDKNKALGSEAAFKIIHEAWRVLSDSKQKRVYDASRHILAARAAARYPNTGSHVFYSEKKTQFGSRAADYGKKTEFGSRAAGSEKKIEFGSRAAGSEKKTDVRTNKAGNYGLFPGKKSDNFINGYYGLFTGRKSDVGNKEGYITGRKSDVGNKAGEYASSRANVCKSKAWNDGLTTTKPCLRTTCEANRAHGYPATTKPRSYAHADSKAMDCPASAVKHAKYITSTRAKQASKPQPHQSPSKGKHSSSAHAECKTTVDCPTLKPKPEQSLPCEPPPGQSTCDPPPRSHCEPPSEQSPCDPPPVSNAFWTACPTCKVHYQFAVEYKEKNIGCPVCFHPFIAIQITGVIKGVVFWRKNTCVEVKTKSADSTMASTTCDNVDIKTKTPPSKRQKVECQDGFHNFDNDRKNECFSTGQVWACYNDDQYLPMNYALIVRIISVKPLKVMYTWLEPCDQSEDMTQQGPSYACGKFKLGKTLTTDSLERFSHIVHSERGERGILKIYPKKGQIWALHVYQKGLNGEEKKHGYELVEVVKDYSDEGVDVCNLTKIPGTKAIFRQQIGMTKQILFKDLCKRFSHNVPAYQSSEGHLQLDLDAIPIIYSK